MHEYNYNEIKYDQKMVNCGDWSLEDSGVMHAWNNWSHYIRKYYSC